MEDQELQDKYISQKEMSQDIGPTAGGDIKLNNRLDEFPPNLNRTHSLILNCPTFKVRSVSPMCCHSILNASAVQYVSPINQPSFIINPVNSVLANNVQYLSPINTTMTLTPVNIEQASIISNASIVSLTPIKAKVDKTIILQQQQPQILFCHQPQVSARYRREHIVGTSRARSQIKLPENSFRSTGVKSKEHVEIYKSTNEGAGEINTNKNKKAKKKQVIETKKEEQFEFEEKKIDESKNKKMDSANKEEEAKEDKIEKVSSKSSKKSAASNTKEKFKKVSAPAKSPCKKMTPCTRCKCKEKIAKNKK